MNLATRKASYSSNNNNAPEVKVDLDETSLSSYSVQDMVKITEELQFLFCDDYQEPVRFWYNNETRLRPHWPNPSLFKKWCVAHVPGYTALGHWLLNVVLLEPLLQDLEFAMTEMLIEEHEEEQERSANEEVSSDYDDFAPPLKIVKTEE